MVGDIRTDSGTGFFNQTGGAVIVGTQVSQNWLRLGINTGGSMVYTLSGASSTLTVLGHIYVGESGSGTLNQYDGVISTPNDNLYIAANSGGAGVYNLAAGTLNTGDIRAGLGGSGTYAQTGGVANLRFWLRLGEGATGTGIDNISGGTVNVGQEIRVGELGTGTLNLSGNALVNGADQLTIGMPIDNSNPATFGSGVVNLSGSTVLNLGGEVHVGGGGGNGVINLGGNAVINVTSAKTFDIGDSLNTFANGNFGASNGTLNQTGGTINTAGGEFWVGEYDNSGETTAVGVNTGVYNLSGGVLNQSNWLAVGRAGGSGTVSMTGGTINKTGSGNNIIVGSLGGNGVWNMNGGLITNTTGIVLGENSNGGSFFLNGGVVQANSVTTYENAPATAVGSFYFNGGTLQVTAGTSSSNYFTATNSYIQAGAAVIDTNGFDTTMSNSFVPDPALIGTDGGLTKIGAGSLTLSGTNTSLGGTRVEGGTLVVASPQAIEDGTSLYVGSAGSIFAPVLPSASAAAAVPVPEPGTLALLAAGALATAAARRRKKRLPAR